MIYTTKQAELHKEIITSPVKLLHNGLHGANCESAQVGTFQSHQNRNGEEVMQQAGTVRPRGRVCVCVDHPLSV